MGKCQAPCQVSLHVQHESPDSMTAIFKLAAPCMSLAADAEVIFSACELSTRMIYVHAQQLL